MAKRKIKFQELVNNYIPYDDESQFEVFRWMIKTGWEFQDKGRWGDSGVFEWLYGLSSIGAQNYYYYYGFNNLNWRKELQIAFVRAIVCQDCPPSVVAWREKEKIFLDGNRFLNFNINTEVPKAAPIYELLSPKWRETPLTTQLNSCWEQATKILSVLLSTNGQQWACNMSYGFDGSSWDHRLADQKDQPFNVFIVEALENLKTLTAGATK